LPTPPRPECTTRGAWELVAEELGRGAVDEEDDGDVEGNWRREGGPEAVAPRVTFWGARVRLPAPPRPTKRGARGVALGWGSVIE
jgi:hypothetical protein